MTFVGWDGCQNFGLGFGLVSKSDPFPTPLAVMHQHNAKSGPWLCCSVSTVQDLLKSVKNMIQSCRFYGPFIHDPVPSSPLLIRSIISAARRAA